MKSSTSDITPTGKILCVGGSPRKGGNTDYMLELFVKSIPGHVQTETIMLRDYDFSPCIGCERCRKDMSCTGLSDGMDLIYPGVIESRGLVLASPTHNYNITAWMKAFIDRLYCFYNFSAERPGPWSSRLGGQGRKAAVVAVCEQENKRDMGFTLEAMRMPLEALGYDVIDELAVFGVFKRGAVRHDDQALQRIADIAKKLADAVASPDIP